MRDALKSDEAQAGSFKLAPRSGVLPQWQRRGLAGEMDIAGSFASTSLILSALIVVILDDASSLVRCLPGDDATNGFFVSCFVRIESAANGEPTVANRKRQLESAAELQDGSRKKKKKQKPKAVVP